MAQRPVFSPTTQVQGWVITQDTQFKWHPGFAVSQKQKSIIELHKAAEEQHGCRFPMEISTKSLSPIGVRLSAFNLVLKTEKQAQDYPLEVVFQSSKVFMNDGPFPDLLKVHPRAAKRDDRLLNSGPLTAFRLNDYDWPLEPKTLFYDWLYLNALQQSGLGEQLLDHDGFTDIEFNPARSLNCQARSAALYVALHNAGKLEHALGSESAFREMFCRHSKPITSEQATLF